MNGTIDRFIEWCQNGNWEIQKRPDKDFCLPDTFRTRYTKIPDEFIQFLSLVDICVAPDEKSWFLCLNEYKEISDIAFSWDEFEKISLEAAEDDSKLQQEITLFWDRYMPIAMSVGSGYSYYALDLGSEYGTVVYGTEPEFEEAEKVSSSFADFLNLIMTGEAVF